MFMKKHDKPEEISLLVTEINKASVGRGLCSAGILVARRLNLKAGEIVEISGNKTTAGIFFPNSEDEGKQIIRMDSLVRLNAGTELGEIVKMKKARLKPARHVVIGPTSSKAQFQPRKIRDLLMNRPVIKGDNLVIIDMVHTESLADTKSDPDTMVLANWLPTINGIKRKRSFTLGEFRLVVLETTPEECIVQITPATKIEINETKIVPG